MPESEQSVGAGFVRVLDKPFRAAAILAGAALAAMFAFSAGQAELDAHIDKRAITIVDSPERIARRSEMTGKHGEYEKALGEQNGRIAALEHNGTEQTLTLAKISVTLEQVQKDVAEIRDEQRSARSKR